MSAIIEIRTENLYNNRKSTRWAHVRYLGGYANIMQSLYRRAMLFALVPPDYCAVTDPLQRCNVTVLAINGNGGQVAP